MLVRCGAVLQINLITRSVYEKEYLGQTAEERLLDVTRRARIGPAEGEQGVTRVESSASNGVQVRAWTLRLAGSTIYVIFIRAA